MEKFKVLSHPADFKIKAFAKTKVGLFIHSAEGMMEAIYSDKAAMLPRGGAKEKEIESEGPDRDATLINWLSDVLAFSDTEDSYCFDFEILMLTDKKIKTNMKYIKAEAIEDIKAVTYHGAKIVENEEGYEVTVLYDV